ncbi:MAG: C45 family autoproteolytic acyltransferase/hydrolase [Desulfobaccales bacterium]
MFGILSGLRSKVFVYLVAAGLVFLAAPPAQACTLFAASGQSVQGGGVIIAKNRDRSPLRSGLKVFVPREGYRHLGLVSLDSPDAPAVAGINEKGLVVDASPSSLPLTEEDCSAVPLTQALLNRCASVDEVLAQKELLRASYPVFEMAADRHKIASIEVAPGGQVSVQVSRQGTLGHTNHYMSPSLLWANQTAHHSSQVRLARINQLLARPGAPYSFADFLVLSQDRNAGPDNSINRLGSAPEKTRTLATFVVHLAHDAPHVFVRTSNPGEPDEKVSFRLEPHLWVKGLQKKIEAMTLGMPGPETGD